jgi:hypothetical protein
MGMREKTIQPKPKSERKEVLYPTTHYPGERARQPNLSSPIPPCKPHTHTKKRFLCDKLKTQALSSAAARGDGSLSRKSPYMRRQRRCGTAIPEELQLGTFRFRRPLPVFLPSGSRLRRSLVSCDVLLRLIVFNLSPFTIYAQLFPV